MDKLRETDLKPEDFDYDLPAELIAQHPAENRSQSRMMVVDRNEGSIRHMHFSDLPEFLFPDDILVMNNSKVFPAKLNGKKKMTGGKCELLLSEPTEESAVTWKCLSKPKLKAGQIIDFKDGIEGRCLGTDRNGYYLVEFNTDDVIATAYHIGRMPLPNYIKRDGADNEEDQERYQTVYASRVGSIAAPTAGLHFDSSILEELKKKGISCDYLTLHVGYGTFQPVYDMETHQMHVERFSLSESLAENINRVRKAGGRVTAVGTTSVRVLETCAAGGYLHAGDSQTDLFIYPPFRFEIVNQMITNFHVPKSSLMMLVSAFAGRDLIMEAYRKAVEHKYRFHSYGDSMIII